MLQVKISSFQTPSSTQASLYIYIYIYIKIGGLGGHYGGDGGAWQVDVCGGDQEDDDICLAGVCWREWQPGGPQEAGECVEG